MIGLPFPDIKSVELSQRMAWMNKRKPGGGQILYQGSYPRTVTHGLLPRLD